MSKGFSRREVFKMGLVAVGAALITKVVSIPSALAGAWDKFKSPPPAGKKVVDPNAGLPKAQKYVHFAAEYKGAKKPEGSKCSSCIQYKLGAEGGAWAPCTVLGAAYVYEAGLCQLYSAKKA